MYAKTRFFVSNTFTHLYGGFGAQSIGVPIGAPIGALIDMNVLRMYVYIDAPIVLGVLYMYVSWYSRSQDSVH